MAGLYTLCINSELYFLLNMNAFCRKMLNLHSEIKLKCIEPNADAELISWDSKLILLWLSHSKIV